MDNTFNDGISGYYQLIALSAFGYKVVDFNFDQVLKYNCGNIKTKEDGTVDVDYRKHVKKDWYSLLRTKDGGFKRSVHVYYACWNRKNQCLDSKTHQIILEACGFKFLNKFEDCLDETRDVELHLYLNGTAQYINHMPYYVSQTFLTTSNLNRHFIQFSATTNKIESKSNDILYEKIKEYM